jgi:hypothetical protein
MNYLERNQQIIAELSQRARLSRGRVLGQSGNSRFTALGSYESDVTGGTVHIGLKQYENDFRILRDGASEDLSFLRTVSARFPDLVPELPLFTGLLAGMEGKLLGLLIEDFSRGGTSSVREMKDLSYTPEDLPMELEELIGPQRNLNELARACFLVTDKDGNVHRRIGDFNTIMLWMGLSKRFEVFPMGDLLEEDLDPHTLKIDYPL